MLGLCDRLPLARRTVDLAQCFRGGFEHPLLAFDPFQELKQIHLFSTLLTVSLCPNIIHVFNPQTKQFEVSSRGRVTAVDAQAIAIVHHRLMEQFHALFASRGIGLLGLVAEQLCCLLSDKATEIVVRGCGQCWLAGDRCLLEQVRCFFPLALRGESAGAIVRDSRLVGKCFLGFRK